MTAKIILLIKIFKNEEYADRFLEQGEMYCGTLGEFKRMDDGHRGDEYEGVTGWHQPDEIQFQLSIPDENGNEQIIEVPKEDLAGPVIFQFNHFEQLNLYCMYAVKVPEFSESYETEEERVQAMDNINSLFKEKLRLSKEAIALGDFAVVVIKVQQFIDRVVKVAKDEELYCLPSSVKYYEPGSFSGQFKGLEAVFNKRDIYQHQNEYRFAFVPQYPQHSEKSRKLFVGSLKDIAIKVPTKKINKLEVHVQSNPVTD